MRGLACLVLLGLLSVGTANARRVVMMPSVPRSCPGTPSWGATATCLERFGQPKVLRSEADLRLVQLLGRDGDDLTSGIYLYVLRDGRWRVGGMVRGARQTFVALTRPRVGTHVLYRLDLRHASDHEVSFDGVSSRPAHLRQQLTVFCAGTSQYCIQVVASCDVFVGGKSYWTFRGTLGVSDRALVVRGDRSKAGELCVQDETVALDLDE